MGRLDFACFGAPSTHNIKLLIIRKSKNHTEFKGHRSSSGTSTTLKTYLRSKHVGQLDRHILPSNKDSCVETEIDLCIHIIDT
jgi:hypothetical protein